MGLSQLIKVDVAKCVNCHQCISVCPVKYCNKANDDHVEVIADLCIGCGECISACEHDARIPLDDTSSWLEALRRGEKIVAVAAPAVASNFPGEYLKLNGWLKSIGVKAIFDVSFGAELTIKSYLEHLKANSPKCIISQPCPALVSYIQLYKPELQQYLAPADSPMMHTMKMVREYYKEYSGHKIMIVSPCVAKKREFEEVGIGDYNVTIKSIKQHLSDNKIRLSSFSDVEYDNPPAERAVLFSTPGGLLRTAMRENPEVINITRKIEGPKIIYEYFEHLGKDIQSGKAPLLIDCLNCDMGCNGGTGTPRDKSVDELEHAVEKRNREMQQKYKSRLSSGASVSKIRKTVNSYWKGGLYGRKYKDLSSTLKNSIRIPSKKEIDSIFHQMQKETKEDIRNCAACGYNSCEKMAVAIHNGLNKVHNCHVFLEKIDKLFMTNLPLVREFAGGNLAIEFQHSGDSEASAFFREFNDSLASIRNMFSRIHELFAITSELTGNVTAEFDRLSSLAGEQNVQSAQISGAIDQISKTIFDNTEKSTLSLKNAQKSVERANTGSTIIEQTAEGMKKIIEIVYNASNKMRTLSGSSAQIGEIIQVIDDIADQTNLLALNAAIEAARAGEQGRGFAVVADEVRKLAERTTKATKEIAETIKAIQTEALEADSSMNKAEGAVEDGLLLSENVSAAFSQIIEANENVLGLVSQLAGSSREQSDSAAMIIQNIEVMTAISAQSASGTELIAHATMDLNRLT
ncbi:MAG: methyl-accepting chemotaxis protein, partial [Syntrophothermus sp.]